MSCVSILFPFIALIIIGLSFLDKRVQERLCLKNCYFKHSSIIAKMLSSKVTLFIIYTIVSTFMTISIFSYIVDIDIKSALFILLYIFVIIMLYKAIYIIIKNTVNENYVKIFSREIAINLSSIILFVVYVYFK